MTDVLDRFAAASGPIDPGPAFREQLWQRFEQQLALPAADGSDQAPADAPELSLVSLRPRGDAREARRPLARRRRLILPAAAAAVVVLLIPLGLDLLSGESHRSVPADTLEVDASPHPSPTTSPAADEPDLPSVGLSIPGSPGRGAAPVVGGIPGPAAAGVPPVRPASAVGSTPSEWLLLYSTPTSTSDSEVRLTSTARTGETRVLANRQQGNESPVFSRDGRRLAWMHAQGSGIPFQIMLADRDGRSPHSLSLPTCGSNISCGYDTPTFSPDGRRLAVTKGGNYSGCTAFEDCDEVRVYDFRTAKTSTVAYGHEPDWSPTRDEIVYSGHAGASESNGDCPPYPYAGYPCLDAEIRIVDVSGSSPAVRTVGGQLGSWPRFSPDGQWIAFMQMTTSSATRQAAVMRRDGSALRALSGCLAVNWAPDGRLACSRAVDGGSDVFLLDRQDRPATRLSFSLAPENGFRLYRR